jgi:hypothetical protein
MMNYMDFSVARIRQNQLIAEAAQERLARQARGPRELHDRSFGFGFHFAIPLTRSFGRPGHRSATTT